MPTTAKVKIDGVDITRSVRKIVISTEVGSYNRVELEAYASILTLIKTNDLKVSVVDRLCFQCVHRDRFTDRCKMLEMDVKGDFYCGYWESK